MDFINKLNEFNTSYDIIKHNIKKSVAKKLIKTGQGGSNNIVIISDDYALKIIPNIINKTYKIQADNDLKEVLFYRLFTNEFIINNITLHIVGFYKKYNISINDVLPHKCLTLDEEIMLPRNKINYNMEKLCYIKKLYEKKFVENSAIVLVLEKCETTISEMFKELMLSKKRTKAVSFKIELRRIIFQLVFTLAVIQDKYPNFIHNDLFLRNILAINEYMYNMNDYIEYIYGNRSYYLPANGLFIKINDFGYSLNLPTIKSTLVDDIKNNVDNSFEIKNNKRDLWTFFYDLYNGANMGSYSILSLINTNIKNIDTRKVFISILQNEIGRFFDYKLIDKINKKNLGVLDRQWSIAESKMLKNIVKLPKKYFEDNTFNYFFKLPTDGRIVRVFNQN
jgi:hypothetical protein